MSKTYRYDPEAGMHPGRKRKESRSGRFAEAGAQDADGGAAESGKGTPGIDPEWAIRRMKRCVEILVDGLVQSGAIRESDREESEHIINIRIWRLCAKYDPARTGKDGRRSSPVHFLTRVAESTARNIRRDAEFRKSVFTLLPTPGGTDGGEDGEPSAGMFKVSARGGREMVNLFLRMDVGELMPRLTEEERVCLAMRMDRESDDAVAEEINLMREREAAKRGAEAVRVDRMYVIRNLRKSIEMKARGIGFTPERMKIA